jgi:hypothetical protein
MFKYAAVGLVGGALLLAGCSSDADVASSNLSKSAEQFEINRRIVFFNGITDKYLLTIEGRCSIEVDDADYQLEVTCKTSETEYKKHFLGLSDNVTYLVEQTTPAQVGVYQYRVIFKPQTILPDVDVSVG